MEIKDFSALDPIKILMLKGEQGEKGESGYDDSEIRAMVSTEKTERERADATINNYLQIVPYVRIKDDDGTFELPVTTIDDNVKSLQSTYSSQKIEQLKSEAKTEISSDIDIAVQALFDKLYPVGSYYLVGDPSGTNKPAIGTWVYFMTGGDYYQVYAQTGGERYSMYLLKRTK